MLRCDGGAFDWPTLDECSAHVHWYYRARHNATQSLGASSAGGGGATAHAATPGAATLPRHTVLRGGGGPSTPLCQDGSEMCGVKRGFGMNSTPHGRLPRHIRATKHQRQARASTGSLGGIGRGKLKLRGAVGGGSRSGARQCELVRADGF